MKTCISNTRKRIKTNLSNVLLMVFSTIIYLASLLYAIIEMTLLKNMAFDQSKLVIAQSLGAIALTFSFPVIEKIFSLTIKFPVRLGISTFAFMGIFLGETCQFYYIVPFWDDILHTTSGLGVALLGSCLISHWLKKVDVKNKNAFIIFGGLAITLSCGLLWEIYEFSFDCIFGMNMQKTIPELDGIFNGGNTGINLNGTEQELADFFKTPQGYRYALFDTMNDMIDCSIGGLINVLILSIISRFFDLNNLGNTFENKAEDIDLEVINEINSQSDGAI